jgi:hypothetical protein
MIIYLLGTGGDALTTMCARGCEKMLDCVKQSLHTGDHHHSEVSLDLGGLEGWGNGSEYGVPFIC